MSTRALRTCPIPGCPALVQSGHCSQHTPTDTRPSARKRGYDRVWEAIRAQVLSEEPACTWLMPDGTRCGSTDSPEVDHKDGNPWNRARTNLRRLCKSHHSSRTGRDQHRGQPGWKRTQRSAPASFVIA